MDHTIGATVAKEPLDRQVTKLDQGRCAQSLAIRGPVRFSVCQQITRRQSHGLEQSAALTDGALEQAGGAGRGHQNADRGRASGPTGDRHPVGISLQKPRCCP